LRGLRFAIGLILACGVLATASDGLGAFLAQTGLDEDLVAVLAVDTPEGVLQFVCVYVDDRTLDAGMGPNMAQFLTDYVGRNAVLVLVGAEFAYDPGMLVFVQGESEVRPRSDNTVPVIGEFLSGDVTPQGMATASLILLGDAIDPGAPFDIAYGQLAHVTMVLDVAPDTLLAAGVPEASDPEPETFGLVPEAVPESPEPDACCDPCAFLCAWWTQGCDPCDPCEVDPCTIVRGGLMFLLLLLGL